MAQLFLFGIATFLKGSHNEVLSSTFKMEAEVCRAAEWSFRVWQQNSLGSAHLLLLAKQMLWRWRSVHRWVCACQSGSYDICSISIARNRWMAPHKVMHRLMCNYQLDVWCAYAFFPPFFVMFGICIHWFWIILVSMTLQNFKYLFCQAIIN